VGSDAVLQHSTLLSRMKLRKSGLTFGSLPESSVLFPSPFWGSFFSSKKNELTLLLLSASSQNARFGFFRGKLRKEMKLALQNFKTITVRDRWTNKMIRYLTRGAINPMITPDPVFAYNQNISEQYSAEELKKKFNLPDEYILFSFRKHNAVSYSWLESFKALAEKDNIACVALAVPAGIPFKHPFSLEINTPLGPKEWYGLIKHSSAYIGENMHPIVIALHNSVPFYSFDSYGIVKYKYFVNEKSSKIYDLLSLADFLEHKINILGRGYKSPGPDEVFLRIKKFDYKKCSDFSEKQYDLYLKMMNNLMSTETEEELSV